MSKIFKSTTETLAFLGVFTAFLSLSNIFTFEIIPPYFVLSVVMTFSFLAGLFLGPWAFIVCFLGDVIGCLIHPFGPYNFIVGLASGLSGLLFGVAFLLKSIFIKKDNVFIDILLFLIAYILVALICTAGLNTLGLFLMYAKGKKTFFAYLSVRFPYQIAVSFINFILSTCLYFALKKISFFKERFFNIDKT